MFTDNSQLKKLTGYVNIEDVISYYDGPKMPPWSILYYTLSKNGKKIICSVFIKKYPMYDESGNFIKTSYRQDIEKFYKNKPESFCEFIYGNTIAEII